MKKTRQGVVLLPIVQFQKQFQQCAIAVNFSLKVVCTIYIITINCGKKANFYESDCLKKRKMMEKFQNSDKSSFFHFKQ